MAISVTADQIGSQLQPLVGSTVAIVFTFLKWGAIFIGAAYILMMLRYNVLVTVREQIKGGKTIVYTIKAREYVDGKSNSPRLRLFHPLIFMGTSINQPPSDCIVAYRGFFSKKMYDFIKKDGLYYPVQNLILGRRYEIPLVAKTQEDLDRLSAAHDEIDEITKKYDLPQSDEKFRSVYSIVGSGLEISRDYDAEQAIENALIAKAETYRNQKPSFIYAAYGLAIILAVGAFSMMIYGLHQFGGFVDAVHQLKEPVQQGVTAAISQKIGPG